MMMWRTYSLDAVADLCLGKMLDKHKNKGDYAPYLANVNVRWGEFDLLNLPLMRFEKNEEERYGLKYGDIVMCEGGEIGRCAIWKDELPHMKIQKALHRIRAKEGVDSFYLYYFLVNLGKRGELESYVTGATIKHLPNEKLRKIVIRIPEYDEQKRISSILQAYDSLIENNRRQIKLLEEAAQRLYKEWFEDLRFPGHEHTPIIDGIPQGWHRGHISDIGTFSRGKTITKEQTHKGSVPVIAGGLAPAYYHDQSNTRPPVVTISASGANAGYVSLYQEPVWASDCSFADADDTENIYLLYGVCTYAQAAINHLRKGAAQPHVYASAVNALEILVGDSGIQRMYEAQVRPLFEKRAVLSQQIHLLSEARDRLLPKLMSGEVEV